MKKYKNILAFSLLEMSVVILIMSILLVGGINLHLIVIERTESQETNRRMNIIQKSVKEYIAKNLRLPCPSNIKLLNNEDGFGEELRSLGECVAESSYFETDNFIYGGVPTKTLDLTSEYAWDPWDSKIIYIIDKRYSTQKGFLATAGESLIVKTTDGKEPNDEVIYIILSTGINRNGAFVGNIDSSKSPTREIIDITKIDEENLFSSFGGVDGVFLADVVNKSFDDYIIYNDRKKLILELEVEDALCSIDALNNLDQEEWVTNSLHNECFDGLCFFGVEIPSTKACANGYVSQNPNADSDGKNKPVRTCQRYGEWSAISYECIDGCGISNIEELVAPPIFNLPTDLSKSINATYLNTIKIGESITIDCGAKDSNFTGYITLKCNETNLKWEILDNSCNSITNIVD